METEEDDDDDVDDSEAEGGGTGTGGGGAQGALMTMAVRRAERRSKRERDGSAVRVVG